MGAWLSGSVGGGGGWCNENPSRGCAGGGKSLRVRLVRVLGALAAMAVEFQMVARLCASATGPDCKWIFHGIWWKNELLAQLNTPLVTP